MFLDLFSIIKQNGNEATIKLADADHPLFQAHFPGNPLLPGFMHLEIASILFKIHFTKIKKAKFNRPVGPGSELKYLYSERKSGMKITVYDQNVVVSEILL
ncbi:MAG: hypothetical protein U9Q62_12070 [Campylobacterota bacterium]|nr:hypothetical protein [Campylobacterota bacterium]